MISWRGCGSAFIGLRCTVFWFTSCVQRTIPIRAMLIGDMLLGGVPIGSPDVTSPSWRGRTGYFTQALGLDICIPLYPSCGNPLLRKTPYVFPGGFDILACICKSVRNATQVYRFSYPDGFAIVQCSAGHNGFIKLVPLPRGTGTAEQEELHWIQNYKVGDIWDDG